jgi:spermidine/putrescine-binding protein
VGKTTNHASDVFWFFKPDTRKVILSQDVTWLDKSKNIITIDFNDRIYDENEKDTKEIKKEKIKLLRDRRNMPIMTTEQDLKKWKI